jgi:hypothetical protein
MLRSRALGLIAMVLLVGLPGCKTIIEPVPVVSWLSPPGCNRDIGVTVSPGAVPTFSWTPNCGISMLVVTRLPATGRPTEETMWGFTVPERSPLGPGIRYGEAPLGVNVWTPPQLLQVGATYRLRVMLTLGGDVAVASGERTFVP